VNHKKVPPIIPEKIVKIIRIHLVVPYPNLRFCFCSCLCLKNVSKIQYPARIVLGGIAGEKYLKSSIVRFAIQGTHRYNATLDNAYVNKNTILFLFSVHLYPINIECGII
jgi:predicted membrane metal-binding protein